MTPADDLTQYKDLYIQTSKEYLQALNDSLVVLEKKPDEANSIETVFRSAHSLKSQSAAMGYSSTGFLCHAIEDVFYEIKQKRLKLTPELADLLFSSFDFLTKSIEQIDGQGVEIDLSETIEQLKKMTGIKTEGAGKSVHNETKEDVKIKTEEVGKPSENERMGSDSKVETKEEGVKKETVKTINSGTSEIKTIPIKITLLDELLDLLEELVVYRLELKKIAAKLNNIQLNDYTVQTDKILDSMQYHIMKARAVPVKMVLDHFPRAVRDLARQENKEIEFEMSGEDLELDRSIVDRLDEPLIHIVRNAVSHGIDKKGKITITVRQDRESGVIEIADNGGGIDWEEIARKARLENETDQAVLNKALFSGISTSKEVTQISGRGVGLTVVKKTIEDFGGSVEVRSKKGEGTTFILRLPMTMAIIKSLLVAVGEERFALPTVSIDRIAKVSLSEIVKTADVEAMILEEIEIPLIRLNKKLGKTKEDNKDIKEYLLVVVVLVEGGRIGLIVDDVFEATEMIIKPVPKILKNNEFYAGVTNLGDGQTALILNPRGLVN